MDGRGSMLLAMALGLIGCSMDPAVKEPGAIAGRRWEARLSGVPQRRSLSCESRSACDLLAAQGIAVDEVDFLAGLPRSDNPNLGFVGDPDGPGGNLPPDAYGVHAGPVAARMREYGLKAVAEEDRSLEWLRAELDAGRPVIVWATTGCRRSERVVLTDARGGRFHAAKWEHTYLAIGRVGPRILLLDPISGDVERIEERTFDAAWAALGRSAVSASGRRLAPR